VKYQILWQIGNNIFYIFLYFNSHFKKIGSFISLKYRLWTSRKRYVINHMKQLNHFLTKMLNKQWSQNTYKNIYSTLISFSKDMIKIEKEHRRNIMKITVFATYKPVWFFRKKYIKLRTGLFLFSSLITTLENSVVDANF
jgi:hypothetical protein